MRRLNIGYDLLTWEGDILRLHFWTHAFEFLKKTGAVFLQTEGRLKGCWVMQIEEDEAATPEHTSADLPCLPTTPEGDAARSDIEPREKVIVRSDGTVTYVGKDMAYQLWKFGLLGKDFHYRVFAERPGEPPLWSTTSLASAASPNPPAFGRASWVCNVIDTRQSYLQKLLKQALAALGYEEQAGHSVHYSYEMVALSHATARELGYDIDVEADRPFVEVSGRKGLGVKADDLIDRLTLKAAGEVSKRNPELTPDEVRRIAEAIAIAAVRYFMVKFSRGKVIVFDIDEALSFEGESGPYLQYAVVRANNIFNKLKERDGLDEAGVRRRAGDRAGRAADGRHRRSARPLGPRARSRAPRRGRRAGGPDAGAVGRGEVRLRPGAVVQRLLPSLPDPQRGARRRPRLARGRGRVLPRAAHEGARADGRDGAGEDVGHGQHGQHGTWLVRESAVQRHETHHRRHPVQPAGRLPVVGRTGRRARPGARGQREPAQVLGEIDGLLLTGGGDVDPVLYGESATRRSTTPSRAATSSRSIWRAARWPPTCRCWRSAAGRRC